MAIIDKPLDDMEASVATTISLEETGDVEQENLTFNPLVTFVKDRYQRNKSKRLHDEARWLNAYRNYRGLYDQNVRFSSEEKSKIFVKVTKTKVLAANAQIQEVLFAGNKFPIGIEPSVVPTSDLDEAVSFDPAVPEQPGAATTSRPQLGKILADLLSSVPGLKSGQGKTPSAQTYYPIQIAAKKMEKQIHDQLEESDASSHLRYVAFELSLFGHGVLKGPFAQTKEYPKWDDKGVYNPKMETIPKVSSVSIWNFYPDAEARNMQDCSNVIERHRMNKSQLRELKRRPHFRKDSIDLAIEAGHDFIPEYWESVLEDNGNSAINERYEVLEYWGIIDKDIAKEAELDIPKELEGKDEFQVNIWICNNQILRFVMNPFTPIRIPYHAVPFELNPYSFFGIGVAENMEDMQTLMNGLMRMAVDNMALSGNVLIEVNETNLVPGQSMEVYPGKIFRTQGGAPGQSIFGTNFPNVTGELMQFYDKARQLTDEATSMPSYAHGGTGVTGMGRTASGMSMLMGAAAQNIKSIVRNIDDYLLAPLGKDLFAFNMQFNFDKEFAEGDLSVVARGTDSLMRTEIRSQRLLQFFQTVASNPVTAPFAKIDYILRELASSLDLDEEKVLNDPREAAIQAAIMGQAGMAAGGQAPQQAGQGGPTPVSDPTGNGNGTIAPGAAPEPNAQGFSGPQGQPQ